MVDKRRALPVVGLVAVAGLAAAAVWFFALRGSGDDTPSLAEGSPVAMAADAFARAWEGGTLDQVPAAKASGDVAGETKVITQGLGVARPQSVSVTTLAWAAPATNAQADAPDRVTAGLHVVWQFGPDRTWEYDTEVDLVEAPASNGGDPVWKVDWEPSVVHDRLGAGDSFVAVRLPAKRGEILDAEGNPLVGLKPVVQVGIRPGLTRDRRGTAQRVADIVGVDGAALADRVEGAGADQVVSVITLRQEAFAPLETQLRGIAAVVLTPDEIPLAPTRGFARALIGTTGAAPAEVAEESGGRIQEGETTGLSGLQAAQDEVLAGTPSLSIRVRSSKEGVDPYELKAFPSVPGASITITIDERVQVAADEVMATAPKPAALVAIRASTGDVLAVANGPAGADGYNRAMVGHYPPGSTFKVASGLTLLENGLKPDDPVDCPATIVVGKEFRNAEGEVLGTVPFRKDFADSCNTAFVGESRKITAQQLTDVAASLGYRKLDLGVPVFGGSVPVTDSDTEHAANMIGQGKVEASPLAVALASASVASGRSVQPRLIIDPASPEPVLGDELPAGPVAALRDLMRGVVTGGTGTALAGVPGGDVAGKTGTAEYGTDDPPRTHAWFTGFQGDVAFAVLVEDGGFGGAVAAPLAAQFLTKLAQG